jgi:hypothetical protein
MNGVTDVRRALIFSLLLVVLFVLYLATDMKYLRDYWRTIVHASIVPGSRWTNLEALGVELAVLFATTFMVSLLGIRRAGLRQTGEMLQHANTEMQTGMRGIDQLRRRVAK